MIFDLPMICMKPQNNHFTTCRDRSILCLEGAADRRSASAVTKVTDTLDWGGYFFIVLMNPRLIGQNLSHRTYI